MSKEKQVKGLAKKMRLAVAPSGGSRHLGIKIFADGANLETMLHYYADSRISGFTTNPTLMRKAGVADYEAFARQVLAVIKDRPISFEVFSDEFEEMERQAQTIAGWGQNTYVKIPITNTKGESSLPLIKSLAIKGIKLNVTAMTLVEQVKRVAPALALSKEPSIVSVFAGRIADAGQDPLPVMQECMSFLKAYPKVELLWASPRELYNVVQAEQIGCHIVTVTEDILKKLPLLGGDLEQVSLDTVRMFYNDAQTAGYQIDTAQPARQKK